MEKTTMAFSLILARPAARSEASAVLPPPSAGDHAKTASESARRPQRFFP